MATQIISKRIMQNNVLATRRLHFNASKISLPTDFFQKSLPYLPLPDIEDSVSMYLDRQKPICNPEKFKTIENMAKRFLQGNGKRLQKQLTDLYSIEKFNCYGGRRYTNSVLTQRSSILEQNNGTLIWNIGSEDQPLERAAKYIYSVGKLMKPLQENTLQPVVMNYNPAFEGILKQTDERHRTQVAQALGMMPFDMAKLPHLFGSCRIPGNEKDTMSDCNNSKNYIIIRNGHIFTFDLLTDTGDVIGLGEIYGALKEIMALSRKRSKSPIAALTVLERTSWAKYRQHLLKDAHNDNMLKIIENSIDVLTLDGNNEEGGLHKNIHIGKSPGDRWFDKSSYCSFDANSEYIGSSSNSVEVHAATATDMAWRIQQIYQTIENELIKSVEKPLTLKRLDFNIDDHIRSAIKQAEKEYHIFRDKFQCEPFARNDINNREFKKRFLNPSSMVQLGLQIALIRFYQEPKAISSVLLAPTFINSHAFSTFEPTTVMADIAKRFVDKEKIEFSALKNYSDHCYSSTLQMRMGYRCFHQHLCALSELSLELDQPCNFLNSDLFQHSLDSYVNVTTVPQTIGINIVWNEFHNGPALTYLFNDDGMHGGFMSIGKGPPIKEYSNLFFEAMEQLIFYISK